MLTAKDVQKHFRAAAWLSPAEVDAFIEDAGAQPVGEVLKLLAILLDRALSNDVRMHRGRCEAFGKLADRTLDQELFVPYVRALKAGDNLVRQTLVPLLPKVNNVGKHSELCSVVGCADPEARRAAAAVLRQVGGQSAFEILQEMVGDRMFSGRAEVLDALVPKAGHHSIPLLHRVLQAGEPQERAHALKFLADTRYMAKDLPGALRVIAAALDDADLRVASRAMSSLSTMASEDEFHAAIGDRVDTTNVLRLKILVEGFKNYPGKRTIAFLTARFQAGPSAIRMAVLDAAAALGDDSVLPLVIEALGNRRIDVRTRAGEVLAELSQNGKVDLARTIIWLLRSRDTNIRRHAVEIAKKVGDKSGELAPRLLRFLRDEDWWVRERVMDALAEMSGHALTAHLVEFLKDPSDLVRRFAIGGLARLKDPRSIGALVRCAMADPDWWVREQAVETVGLLKDARAIPYLLEVMATHSGERVACLQALGAIGGKEAGARVAALVMDADPDVRFAAIDCLGKFDDRAHGDVVRRCEKDDVFRVRAAAQELLARWAYAPPAAEGVEGAANNVLDRMLAALAQAGADDLILATGRVPYVKKLGKMAPFSKTVFNGDLVRAILVPHLSVTQINDLENRRDVDFSYEVKAHKLRFRGHIFNQMSGLSAVFRIVKNDIPRIESLGLPDVVSTFGTYKNGLVLVGGPTGSGKSTTLAALVDFINRTSSRHILTIEDPIEAVHTAKKSLLNQREVGSHTPSFATALRSTLRQDPDVILVGELRDLQTIAFAVSAAETGHLVFGTVHTVSADTSIDRIINTFPAGQQPQVRSMLAETLRAVVCQHLVRTKDGAGRSIAVEVMLSNDATANLIRKGKTFQIPSVIATGRELGMQSMDSDLIRLVKTGVISEDDGFAKATDKKAFEAAVGILRKPGVEGAPVPAKLVTAVQPNSGVMPTAAVASSRAGGS